MYLYLLISWVHLPTLMFFQCMHVLAIKCVYLCSGNSHAYCPVILHWFACASAICLSFILTTPCMMLLFYEQVLVLLYMCISSCQFCWCMWLVIWCNPCKFILMLHKPKYALPINILSVYIYCPYLSINYICMLLSKAKYMPLHLLKGVTLFGLFRFRKKLELNQVNSV